MKMNREKNKCWDWGRGGGRTNKTLLEGREKRSLEWWRGRRRWRWRSQKYVDGCGGGMYVYECTYGYLCTNMSTSERGKDQIEKKSQRNKMRLNPWIECYFKLTACFDSISHRLNFFLFCIAPSPKRAYPYAWTHMLVCWYADLSAANLPSNLLYWGGCCYCPWYVSLLAISSPPVAVAAAAQRLTTLP